MMIHTLYSCNIRSPRPQPTRHWKREYSRLLWEACPIPYPEVIPKLTVSDIGELHQAILGNHQQNNSIIVEFQIAYIVLKHTEDVGGTMNRVMYSGLSRSQHWWGSYKHWGISCNFLGSFNVVVVKLRAWSTWFGNCMHDTAHCVVNDTRPAALLLFLSFPSTILFIDYCLWLERILCRPLSFASRFPNGPSTTIEQRQTLTVAVKCDPIVQVTLTLDFFVLSLAYLS